MLFLRILVLCLGVVATLARGGEAAERAMVLEAQRRLGGEIPSWPVEIRNRRHASLYPRTTHALVFAWRDGLWFYCPVDGTQNLSRYRFRTEQDRADLLPLLQRLEPGFASYRELPAENAPPAEAAPKALRNGCFIESLAFARGLAGELPRALRADLVSYYTELGGKQYGHSVVWFATADGDFVFDPDTEPRVQPVRLGDERTPLAFARRVADRSVRGAVARTVTLPVELAGADDTAFAVDRARGAVESGERTVIR